MSAFASLNGVRITGGSITVPYYGAWSGDVELVDATVAPSEPMACTVVLGNLSLVGTAYRQAEFAGTTTVRLVGGGGGWRKGVHAQHYQADGGLALSTLVGDAAIVVHERVAVADDVMVGTDYVRATGSGEDVVRQLFGSGWWVDQSGTTQLAPRIARRVQTAFQAIEWDGSKGQFSIATEDYASWLPGATFSGPTVPVTQAVSSCSFVVDNDGTFRLDVLTTDPDQVDRIISPIDAIIRSAMPRTYDATYGYVVQATSGVPPAPVYADIEPASSIPLPSMRNIRLLPSILGGGGAPSIGSACRVQFLNGDPTKPFVSGVDSVDVASIQASGEVKVGAGSSPVTLFAPLATWVAALTVAASSSFVVPTFPPTIGSSKLFSE